MNWQTKKLEEVCDLITTRGVSPKYVEDDGIPVLTLGDVEQIRSIFFAFQKELYSSNFSQMNR